MGELIRFGLNTPAIFVVLFVIIILGALAWVRGIIDGHVCIHYRRT